jgi:hypothetical protein
MGRVVKLGVVLRVHSFNGVERGGDALGVFLVPVAIAEEHFSSLDSPHDPEPSVTNPNFVSLTHFTTPIRS